MSLTGKQRRQLRGLGHGLPPVVQIGKAGLSDSVKAAIEEQLLAHELIKIRRTADCPLDKHAIADAIAAGLGAEIAQKLGHTLLLYRAHPETPGLELV